MNLSNDIVEKILNSELDPVQRSCFRIAGRSLGLLGVRPRTESEALFERTEVLILDALRGLMICSTLLNNLDPTIAGYAKDYHSKLANHISYDMHISATRAALEAALPNTKPRKIELLRKCLQASLDKAANLVERYAIVDDRTWDSFRKAKAKLALEYTSDISAVVNAMQISKARVSLTPALTPDHVIYPAWKIARARLLRRSQTWKLWVDWYQYRFLGETSPEVPNALWKAIESDLCQNRDFLRKIDPVHVNGIFAETVIRHVEQLIDFQSNHIVSDIAPQIELTDNSIKITPADIGQESAPNKSAIFELISAINTMRDECEKNSASFLKDDLENYARSFSEDGWNDPIPFVVRGDIQRRSLDAIMTKPIDSDLPELSDRTLLAFRNLIRAHNFVISLHPEMKKIDDNLREGFGEIDADPLSKIRDIVDLYKSKKMIDDQSRETLNFLESRDSDSMRREGWYILWVGFLGNFVQAASAWVWKNRISLLKGTVSVGTATYAAGAWMIANEAWVLRTFPLDSSIGSLVRAALEVLKQLPLL